RNDAESARTARPRRHDVRVARQRWPWARRRASARGSARCSRPTRAAVNRECFGAELFALRESGRYLKHRVSLGALPEQTAALAQEAERRLDDRTAFDPAGERCFVAGVGDGAETLELAVRVATSNQGRDVAVEPARCHTHATHRTCDPVLAVARACRKVE